MDTARVWAAPMAAINGHTICDSSRHPDYMRHACTCSDGTWIWRAHACTDVDIVVDGNRGFGLGWQQVMASERKHLYGNTQPYLIISRIQSVVFRIWISSNITLRCKNVLNFRNNRLNNNPALISREYTYPPIVPSGNDIRILDRKHRLC